MSNACALALVVGIVGALVFSQTAHAEDSYSWAVTLGGVKSDGCAQSSFYMASETQLRLDLTDPLAPTLSLEALFTSDSDTIIDGKSTYIGPQWGRRAATFKGFVTAIDLDQKTWAFVLQSEKIWNLESPPSPLDPPLPPPDTTNTPTDSDTVFTLTCVPEKLALTDGPEIVALQCDLIAQSGVKGLWLIGLRDDKGAHYNQQRFYFRQGGSLNGFSHDIQTTWQEAPVSERVWGE